MPTPVAPFVVGYPRSGNTLLGAMLDSHPAMAVVTETELDGLLRRRRRLERAGGLDVDGLVRDLRVRTALARDLDEPTLRAAVASVRTVPDAIRAVYRQLAAGDGAPRYGDRTPGHVRVLPLLAGALPEARFVHIVRDGRDVAAAFLDADWGPTSVLQAAVAWRRWLRRGRADGHRLGPTRYRELRYERLVAEPAAVLGRLGSYLDLPYDPAMLRFHERRERYVRAPRQAVVHATLLQPPTPGLRDWRRELTEEQIATFELVAGDVLDALRYPRSGIVPTARLRSRVAAAARAHELRQTLEVRRRVRAAATGLRRVVA